MREQKIHSGAAALQRDESALLPLNFQSLAQRWWESEKTLEEALEI